MHRTVTATFRLKVLSLCFPLLATPGAIACGVDFQVRLLEDRAATLEGLYAGSFMLEAQSLALQTPYGQFTRLPEQGTHGRARNAALRNTIEEEVLGPSAAAKIRQARSASTDSEALAYLEGLPEAARHYTLAARAWHRLEADHSSSASQQVLALFEAVPSADPAFAREPWRLWGLYMRARMLEESPRESLPLLQHVQAWHTDGHWDPLEVGPASFTLAGGMYLDYLGDVEAAVLHYATAFGMGSYIAYTSLLEVARYLTREPDRWVITDAMPLTQQLLMIYAFTHGGVGPQRHQWIVENLTQETLRSLPGVDRLAGYLYARGEYALAEAMLPPEPTALSLTISAKLALRAGNRTAAAGYFRDAVTRYRASAWPSHFPIQNARYGRVGGHRLTPPQSDVRLQAELAVLGLVEGELVASLDQLMQLEGYYWQDIAYIAEVLVPTDDLLARVQAYSESWTATDQPVMFSFLDTEGFTLMGIQSDPVQSLRYLLARRLVREGRIEEALPFFDFPRHRELAHTLLVHLQASETQSGTKRAKALWDAALLYRQYGLRLASYELAPDWKLVDAAYTLDRYRTWQPAGVCEDGTVNPYVSSAEAAVHERQSRPPPSRYHYRFTAVDWALEAASLVDPQSDDFRALTCRAAGWIVDRDPKRASEIFRYYVNAAKPSEDVVLFGRRCGEPFPSLTDMSVADST